jgi:ABC-2 type transport system permease protein
MATGWIEQKRRYRQYKARTKQLPANTDIWIALGWCVGILILAYTLAMATYRRRIS